MSTEAEPGSVSKPTMMGEQTNDNQSDGESSSSEEFFDAVSANEKVATDEPEASENKPQLSKPTASLMGDSGVFSMHSSHVESDTTQQQQQPLAEIIETKLEEAISELAILSEKRKSLVGKEVSDKNEESSGETKRPSESMPRPPPRTRKRHNLKKIEITSDPNGNNSSASADSHSMTNSVESNTLSLSHPGHNLTSILDDIQSIKGDLILNDVDDKRSVYLDEHLQNLKHFKQKFFPSSDQKELQKSPPPETIPENQVPPRPKPPEPPVEPKPSTSVEPQPNENPNTPLSSDPLATNCLNPLSLHLMKITNEYDENNSKSNSLEKESTSIADTTFKSVTSLISSTLNDIKNEKKNRSFERRSKKKMKESCKNEENETSEFNVQNDDADDDDDDDDKNSVEFKDGKLKSKFKDLKKLGSGLIRGVRGVSKSSVGKERSTFHVDLKPHPGEPEPTPPPPRFKLKVNHKRGSADFDGLKLMQEINDCKGAIWCMKFSNCSQLLAAAGQDHLLRVYCCQKSWKYFTQLRNKASGQHVSPNSTKERGSSNGDSFGRKHRYSRSGSLNANDSHNNSSSSSSSSAFAKEFYKEEDNTLSEEGPLLLFTIYRGHTADVLDLAWSKNHFLLSSSMDKTVRLWHITRIECLCTFRHIDFVTTIQFHPRDDRYFLSGSLDGKLRLWNIPDKRVTLWNEVNSLSSQRGGGNNNNTGETDMSSSHGLITASSFVQNGKFAVIGTYDGRIIFYTTDQLKYFTQIHVSVKNNMTPSSQRGPSLRSRINKVTGIESVDDNSKILVTTNDSRLRLYDLRDLSLTCKYKGCINQSSQIKAAISHDHKYIICGSENNSFYIWRIQDNSTIGQRRDRNKQYECIRLLNPPASQTTPYEPVPSATISTTSNPSVSQEKPDSGTISSESNVVDSKVQGQSSTTTATPSTSQTQSQAAYSSAATKIVTSAIFAPVPGQIDEKARYVIAISDFNGFIRIFSK